MVVMLTSHLAAELCPIWLYLQSALLPDWRRLMPAPLPAADSTLSAAKLLCP